MVVEDIEPEEPLAAIFWCPKKPPKLVGVKVGLLVAVRVFVGEKVGVGVPNEPQV